MFILHYHICTSCKVQLPAAGPRHQVHLDVLLLLGGRHPAQLRHQPRVADPHRAAVAEVLGVVLLRVQRQVARSLNIPPLVFYGGFMVNLNTVYTIQGVFQYQVFRTPCINHV